MLNNPAIRKINWNSIANVAESQSTEIPLVKDTVAVVSSRTSNHKRLENIKSAMSRIVAKLGSISFGRLSLNTIALNDDNSNPKQGISKIPEISKSV